MRTTPADCKPLDGLSVLVVEDEPLIGLELEMVLEDAGATVVGLCRSPREALALLDHAEPDAAILDFGLGNETSAPIARRLSAAGKPFCFYSGEARSDPRFWEWAGVALLPKPARPRAIVDALLGILTSPPRRSAAQLS